MAWLISFHQQNLVGVDFLENIDINSLFIFSSLVIKYNLITCHHDMLLMFGMLGKKLSGCHFKIFFLVFPRKCGLKFHANCLLRRQLLEMSIPTFWVK